MKRKQQMALSTVTSAATALQMVTSAVPQILLVHLSFITHGPSSLLYLF
jgi:hypothetical protein